MADQKLSQLTSSGALTGAELAYVVQGGNSRRTTLAAIVALAAGTDLSYTASTRLLSSSTGADVTLPLFTSTLAGLVGASGGGTSNFLRADGTWAAPPASAGTDLSYDQATRLLSSSTGAGVTLPLATDALDGLQSAAHRALVQALIAAGVTAAGSTVTIPHIHGDLAGPVYIHVKNTSGAQLTKGTPVRVVGAVGDTSTLEVAAADAASAGTMPAIGILSDTLAVNGTGHAVVAGELLGMATGSYSVGQALYVASGGGLTATKPSVGTIQQVAIVGRVNASTGSITVTIGSLQSPNWDTAYSERLRWDGGATGLDAATGRTSLGLGNAAQGTIGTAAGNVVALDGSARLPAVDGSQLTGLPSAPVTSVAGRTGAITLAAADIGGLGSLATQSGTFSGTSSGTNTGDQTITLTGDVTGSGAGSFAATIANGAVTYAKIQNVSATDRILGRSSAGAGAVEEISCTAAGRALLDDADATAQRTTLSAAASGAITGSGLTMATARLLGRSTAGTGAVEEITVGSGLSLSGGTLATSAVAYSQHSTLTASASTYTLDATAFNEFTASAAIAGNITITCSNLSSVPSGQVWRAVFRFSYTSGAITLAAPAGVTAKGSVGTLTAGQTYDLVVRFIGGGTIVDYRLGGGFTT